MLQRNGVQIWLSSVIIALGSQLYGCGGSSSSNTPTPTPVPPAPMTGEATKILGSVVDAGTAALLGGATFTVSGADSGSVVDSSGNSVLDSTGNPMAMTTSDGFISLALKDGVTPSDAAPVSILVTVTDAGYFGGGQTVTITQKGTQQFVINLVSMTAANAPAGVGVSASTGTATDGKIVDASGNPVVITTSTATTNATSVTIPADTVATMADGTTKASGAITTNVANFSNLPAVPTATATPENGSLAAFPGGFDVTSSDGSGAFVTGGFLAIDMTDSSGASIKSFAPPIDVTMGVPSSTFNPDKGAPVQEGDSMPLWSYAPTTGAWTNEGTGTVKKNATSGNLEVTFPVQHLSYWNMDWLMKDSDNKTCTAAVSLTKDAADARALLVQAVADSGYLYSKHLDKAGTTFSIPKAPKALPVTIKVFVADTGAAVGTPVQVADLCGTIPPVDVPVPTTMPTGSVVVNVSEACSGGGNAQVVPSSAVMHQVQMSDGSFGSYVADGKTDDTTGSLTIGALGTGLVNVFIENRRAATFVEYPNVSVTDGAVTTINQVFPLDSSLCTVPTGGTGQ